MISRCCLVVVGLALGPARVFAQSPTFSDGTFNDADWSAAIISDTTPLQNATSTSTQMANGGNPDSYRETTHNWCGDGVGSDGLIVRHLHAMFVWDPASDGPIDSMTYAFDALFSPFVNPFAVAVILAAQQNGFDYGVYNVAVSPSWTSFSRTGIHGSDFAAYSSGAPPIDFSANGAPIQFGYMTGNGTGNNECLSTMSGLDNLSITITSTTVVEPPDAGVADAEADAGEPDAAMPDAGVDSGTADSGTADSGTADSGAVDSGSVDAGLRDSGSVSDSGANVDAGSTGGDEDGCTCRAARPADSGAILLIALVALLRARTSGRSDPRRRQPRDDRNDVQQ